MVVMQLTPGAVVLQPGSTEIYHTGSWRHQRPVYEDKVASCQNACPAGVDIPKVLGLAGRGLFFEAYKAFKENNPLPAVCGRVCYHPCEGSCNRGQYDQSLAMHNIERFIGDYALEQGPQTREQSALIKPLARIAVVGSGPSGLSCAYYLARLNYEVDVVEALPVAGGMLAVGIPAYRLPKNVLRRELELLQTEGIRIMTGTPVNSLDDFVDYRAVYLATGASGGALLGISGEDAPGVYQGLEFLKSVNLGTAVLVGKKVAVIGGGNTAMDCARAALRLGCDVTVIYRRTRQEMPAAAEEIEEALAEGVKMMFLAAPREVATGADGRVASIRCEKMVLEDPDASGRRRPVPVEGSEFRLDADTVVAAVGQGAELSYLPPAVARREGLVQIDETGYTGFSYVYAGGDAAYGVTRRVVDAIASGRRAALTIDRQLRGGAAAEKASRPIVTFESLKTDYFTPWKRVEMPQRTAAERVKDFAEVNRGYTPEQAMEEAVRCFSCGLCNECKNCWAFCPDIAIKKEPGAKFKIDLDYCKGCGICVNECPRSAIKMTGEEG